MITIMILFLFLKIFFFFFFFFLGHLTFPFKNKQTKRDKQKIFFSSFTFVHVSISSCGFLRAIISGNEDVIQIVLSVERLDIFHLNPFGYNAIHVAGQYGSVLAGEIFEKRGFQKWNDLNEFGDSPLHVVSAPSCPLAGDLSGPHTFVCVCAESQVPQARGRLVPHQEA